MSIPPSHAQNRRVDSEKKMKPGKPLLQFAEPKRGKPPLHLADIEPGERAARVKELGIEAFRAKQLATHYFDHYTSDPEKMTDLPKTGREELVGKVSAPPCSPKSRGCKPMTVRRSNSCGAYSNGALVESVLMRYTNRITLCVSSQAGCGMNCPVLCNRAGGASSKHVGR